MRISEREFWRSTPRKIYTLWREYLRVHGHVAADDGEDDIAPQANNIVYRDGKPYCVIKPQNASWMGGMMK